MAEESALDKMMRAPEYQIRAILLSLCDDEEIRKKALKRYASLTAYDQPSKRKAVEDLHVCVQCDAPFTREDNKFGDCLFHPGDMEPDFDGDFWADHDEDCHGTIDSKWCREEYPDGFRWDCCDRLGTEVGCRKGKHEAHPDKKGTGVFEANKDFGSDEEEDDSEDEDDGEEY